MCVLVFVLWISGNLSDCVDFEIRWWCTRWLCYVCILKAQRCKCTQRVTEFSVFFFWFVALKRFCHISGGIATHSLASIFFRLLYTEKKSLLYHLVHCVPSLYSSSDMPKPETEHGFCTDKFGKILCVSALLKRFRCNRSISFHLIWSNFTQSNSDLMNAHNFIVDAEKKFNSIVSREKKCWFSQFKQNWSVSQLTKCISKCANFEWCFFFLHSRESVKRRTF